MHSVSVSVHEASGVMPCLRMDGGVAGRATAFWLARNGKACTSGEWGPASADEVVLEAQKGLEAQSAMADVSLAAMAGVTAADHERISKSYLVKSRVWA